MRGTFWYLGSRSGAPPAWSSTAASATIPRCRRSDFPYTRSGLPRPSTSCATWPSTRTCRTVATGSSSCRATSWWVTERAWCVSRGRWPTTWPCMLSSKKTSRPSSSRRSARARRCRARTRRASRPWPSTKPGSAGAEPSETAAPKESTLLFRGMDRAALDVAYNNTAAVGVPKRDQYVSGWSARSDALRKTRDAKIDLRYGDGPRQRLDVFSCGKAGAPTVAYIHGGYWQMNDKEPYAFFGEALVPAGFNLALLEYTLAPAARLDQIVAEVRAAVAWVIEHAAEHGNDSCRVFVAGHSAGGHLTAAAMSDPRVAGGLAISGIYDLEPIRLNYLNDKLRLDTDRAMRNRPILH